MLIHNSLMLLKYCTKFAPFLIVTHKYFASFFILIDKHIILIIGQVSTLAGTTVCISGTIADNTCNSGSIVTIILELLLCLQVMSTYTYLYVYLFVIIFVC